MKSELKEIGPVEFPAFSGERVYMLPFTLWGGLPAHLSRWQATVDAMLSPFVGQIVLGQSIYLMIDQACVSEGKVHRRPGLHIDGYWNADFVSHGGSPAPSHRPTPSHGSRAVSWAAGSFEEPEAIILASNVEASRALVGEFNATIGEGGDCGHISGNGLEAVSLRAGIAYAGNVTCLHQSLPVTQDCQRTLVRLNVPGLKL